MNDTYYPLVAFVFYSVGVFLLALFSHRLLKKKTFLNEYFLGSRGLGVWALAMSYAATSASGGSFMGFPALIYQHGWILALWIASYMIVPLTCMGILGKRLNQVARKTGAITIPDVFRDRFENRKLGVVSSALIIFFLVFYLVAQFKAGAIIVKILLKDVPLYQSAAAHLSWVPENLVFTSSPEDPGYYLALLLFAIAVIVYTAYGGFRAVVWTDVLQGIVMFFGVLCLLFFTLKQLPNGIEGATRELESRRYVGITLENPTEQDISLPGKTPLVASSAGHEWTFEIELPTRIGAGDARPVTACYTAAAELPQTMPPDATFSDLGGATVQAVRLEPQHDLVSGPGFHAGREAGFLPWALAISFFVMWAISGAGQPTTMLRLMAFKDTKVYRRAMFSAGIYYTLIYVPLIIVFVCGRTLVPASELDGPDDAMPKIVLHVVPSILAGVILAAPFAAVMSSVDSFLLAISSSFVRDIYQREYRPQASEATLKRLSYTTTVVIGTIALIGAINPPMFLQHIIVLASAGLACCFLAPMFFTLYWKRMTSRGVLTGMLGGLAVYLSLAVAGWVTLGGVQPYQLGGFLPVVWGLLASIFGCVAGSLSGPPAPEHLVRRYFNSDES